MRRRPSKRSQRSLSSVVVAALLVALDASAAKPTLEVELQCEPALGLGRIRCTLRSEVPRAQRLAWIDALVVEAPAFARPLRTRIAHRGSSDGSKVELALALLATGEGEGRLLVRARAVVCPRSGNAACRPQSKEASLLLRVGR